MDLLLEKIIQTESKKTHDELLTELVNIATTNTDSFLPELSYLINVNPLRLNPDSLVQDICTKFNIPTPKEPIYRKNVVEGAMFIDYVMNNINFEELKTKSELKSKSEERGVPTLLVAAFFTLSLVAGTTAFGIIDHLFPKTIKGEISHVEKQLTANGKQCIVNVQTKSDTYVLQTPDPNCCLLQNHVEWLVDIKLFKSFQLGDNTIKIGKISDNEYLRHTYCKHIIFAETEEEHWHRTGNEDTGNYRATQKSNSNPSKAAHCNVNLYGKHQDYSITLFDKNCCGLKPNTESKTDLITIDWNDPGICTAVDKKVIGIIGNQRGEIIGEVCSCDEINRHNPY